jgi:hypothetical protein
MRPGACTALTKIDFNKLGGFTIKPIGIYGSKVEIVRFLRSLNSVDEDVCVIFVPSLYLFEYEDLQCSVSTSAN